MTISGPFMKPARGKALVFVAVLIASSVVMVAQELRLQDAGSSSASLSASNLETAPLDPARRNALQEAIKTRDYARAETILAQEIEKNPKTPQLLTLLGSVFFLDGKYLNTAIAMNKAEAITPLDDPNRFTLALSYIILNHRDWARPELEKLARSDPKNALYPYWLGRIEYDAMQFTAAISHLQKTLELNPNFMKGYDNLALCYEAVGKYDEAIQTYKEAIRLNRQKPVLSPWPPLNLATLLVKIGRLEEAETFLQESLRYDPRFPKAHYQMGLLLEKQSKDNEAIRELNEAAALDPTYPEPHYVLGKIYRRTGDPVKAKAAWATFQKLKKEKKDERPH
jgi:tetratricopeptide (TPR) repeat protein